MVCNKLVKPCSPIQPSRRLYPMMTFNGVKNTIFLLEQQCRTQVVIEESKLGRWNRNACVTPPGMLLSDSLEHNYCKHWSKHRMFFISISLWDPFYSM